MEEISILKTNQGYSLAASAHLPVGSVAIETQHEVAPGWPDLYQGDFKFEPCVCIWDSGATYCGISGILADKWNLQNFGNAKMRIGDNTVIEAPSYAVTLRLSDGSEHQIIAVRQDLTGIDVIIGLTLISEGRFTITPTTKHGALFTFEVPKK